MDQIDEIKKLLLKHFGKKWEYLERPALEVVNEDTICGIARQICRIKIDERYAAPVCILAPPREGPHRALIVIHGGDGGLDVCCGAGLGRSGDTHYHHNMSLELAEAGLLTITVSIRGLGKEAQDWGFGDIGRQMETRDDIVGYTIFRGSCPMNVWTHDVIKILDAFEDDPRIDKGRIGHSWNINRRRTGPLYRCAR